MLLLLATGSASAAGTGSLAVQTGDSDGESSGSITVRAGSAGQVACSASISVGLSRDEVGGAVSITS